MLNEVERISVAWTHLLAVWMRMLRKKGEQDSNAAV